MVCLKLSLRLGYIAKAATRIARLLPPDKLARLFMAHLLIKWTRLLMARLLMARLLMNWARLLMARLLTKLGTPFEGATF